MVKVIVLALLVCIMIYELFHDYKIYNHIKFIIFNYFQKKYNLFIKRIILYNINNKCKNYLILLLIGYRIYSIYYRKYPSYELQVLYKCKDNFHLLGYIYVGPKKLWPWPAFTLGPKPEPRRGPRSP